VLRRCDELVEEQVILAVSPGKPSSSERLMKNLEVEFDLMFSWSPWVFVAAG